MSRRLAAWIVFVALLAAVASAGGSAPRDALYRYSTAVGEAVLYLVILAVTLAISGLRPDLLALRRPVSWTRTAAVGIPVLVGVYLLVGVLDSVLHGAREQGFVPSHWEPRHAGAYAANVVVIAAVAPVVEELLFRGVGFGLLARFGRWPAILLVGLAFGLYHGLPRALPELALFGCALAWLRARTASVYPGMLAHAAFNAIALASVLFR
jgi:membrane protease YdiL (CAAX protease family)